MTFLLAGHETTAAALAFSLHFLATSPELQQQCYEEVCVSFADYVLLSKLYDCRSCL